MLEKLTTELRNPKSMDLDKKSMKEILLLMNEEDIYRSISYKKEICKLKALSVETIKFF